MRLSIAIATHASRLDNASRLLQLLPGAVVALDPEPNGPATALRAAERAWAAVATGSTHHLVLQDDVEPIADFASTLPQVLQAAPYGCISLHTAWMGIRSQYLRLGALGGAGFVRTPPERLSPQAVILPSDEARAYASVLRDVVAKPPLPVRDSPQLIQFLRQRELPVLQTVPSLIEHDAGERRSLLPDMNHGIRRAALFGRWDGSQNLIVDPDVVPYLSPGDQSGHVHHEGESHHLWPWVQAHVADHRWFFKFSRQLADEVGQASSVARILAPELLLEGCAVSALSGLTLGVPVPLSNSETARRALSTLLPGCLYAVLTESALSSLMNRRVGEVLLDGALRANAHLRAERV